MLKERLKGGSFKDDTLIEMAIRPLKTNNRVIALRLNEHHQQLSIERMEKHLSAVARIPYYENKLSQLRIGLEQESIIHRSENPDLLMNEKEAKNLAKILKSRAGFNSPHTPKNHKFFTLGRETKDGYIAVKPDFAFNNLELSFPPAREFEDLLELVTLTLANIDAALDELGFVRSSSSIVEKPNVPFSLVPLERLQGYLDQFPKRSPSSERCYYPHYPALIASTQVHLNLSPTLYFELVESMYEIEWLAISTFSRSKRFDGDQFGCARVLMYEHSLGQNYKLKTVPQSIPKTITEYVDLHNLSPQYFSEDPFFPVRDLSFIRPRPFGTCEFRSACSQHTAQEILSVAAFRIAQLIYSQNKHINPTQLSKDWSRNALLRHAWKDIPSSELNAEERSVKRKFINAIDQLPKVWADLITSTLKGKE